MIITSGITQSSSSTAGIFRQNINLSPISYDGCAKVFSKRCLYNRGFLLPRCHAAAAVQQLDLNVADQLRSFGILALICRLRRTRDRRHVVSLGYRGCRSGRRHGRSTPIVQSVIDNGQADRNLPVILQNYLTAIYRNLPYVTGKIGLPGTSNPK
jgi:hypothetical protein